MNNKPVAWIGKPELQFGFTDTRVTNEKENWDDIPLYTHPVKEQGNPVAWRSQDYDGYWSVYQAPVKGSEPLYTGFKELTDEEILEICDLGEWHRDEFAINFARAILRKAQQK